MNNVVSLNWCEYNIIGREKQNETGREGGRGRVRGEEKGKGHNFKYTYSTHNYNQYVLWTLCSSICVGISCREETTKKRTIIYIRVHMQSVYTLQQLYNA